MINKNIDIFIGFYILSHVYFIVIVIISEANEYIIKVVT